MRVILKSFFIESFHRPKYWFECNVISKTIKYLIRYLPISFILYLFTLFVKQSLRRRNGRRIMRTVANNLTRWVKFIVFTLFTRFNVIFTKELYMILNLNYFLLNRKVFNLFLIILLSTLSLIKVLYIIVRRIILLYFYLELFLWILAIKNTISWFIIWLGMVRLSFK